MEMATQIVADELATTIDAVRAGLAKPEAETVVTFVADCGLDEDYRASINIRDFSLRADEPPSIGGADTGPTPVELTLASLGTCQEIVYATYARILGIPLDKVSVHTEGRLDLRGFYGVADVPVGFGDVSFTVEISSPASPEEIERLVQAVNTHCPVLEILRNPVPVTGSYQLNGEALPVDEPQA
jgi:putative redox protein